MSFNAAGITKHKRDFGPTPPGYTCPISEQYIYKSKNGDISLIQLIDDESWELLCYDGCTENFATQAMAETRIMELLA